ncbi:PP2C family protein-serine/threonine phosphatase [Geomesophilobacter sediminis]|uniref:SpoIIE family protein phosphatase n=1 Tax=Geomesophilobacter sediminis TaxID=2798584 RepID=A0A8J7J773_9BACT|nr:SpoIIE family protein phosphatase [Geomesophilobacter sediminis]MBJ6724916.1 SpoIIE family protein phosphatase [Geomesophilobacter sediminis]
MNRNILVVDDSRAMREVIPRILREAGFECCAVEGVDQALEELERDSFGLVLCDIEMPGKNGIVLLKEIVSTMSDIFVVMLTGVTDPVVVMECMHLGAKDYVMKPFDAERLRVTVKNTLEQRQLFLEHRSYQLDLEQKVLEQTEQIRVNLEEKAMLAKEMEIAQEIQSALIPQFIPGTRRIHFATHYRPAGVLGGDYFDVFFRGDGIMDVVIADVAGHNVGSALIVAEIRGAFQAHSAAGLGCAEMLALLNESLYDDLTRAGLFFSMFYLRLDERRMTASYSCAGHNPALYVHADGRVAALDTEGMIIGVVPKISFEERSLPLCPGDRLILYTDGSVEAENRAGRMYGLKRLARSFKEGLGEESGTALQRALADLNTFTEGVPLKDDLALVVATVRH